MSEHDDDPPTATIYRGDSEWHGGPGWYWVDDEYPDEGSCGPFETAEECEAHAREAGYRTRGTCALPEEHRPHANL